MNIYHCDACHYTFTTSTDSVPPFCPDCGKTTVNSLPAVRPATEQEIETYYLIRKEIEAENAEFSEPSLTT